MDEIFHVQQTQTYCDGRFSEWNQKITTFPGLYFASLAAVYSIKTVSHVIAALAGSVLFLVPNAGQYFTPLIDTVAVVFRQSTFAAALHSGHLRILEPLTRIFCAVYHCCDCSMFLCGLLQRTYFFSCYAVCTPISIVPRQIYKPYN